MYPIEIVQPMKNEMLNNGFSEMTSATEVDEIMKKSGTSLVLINSVCGCSAGSARPGVIAAAKNASKQPDRLLTVFAGYDVEALQQFRTYLMPYPPSSPAIALIKDGQLVHFIERHMIEGRPADMIADNLIDAINTHC